MAALYGTNPHTDHIHFSLSWAGAKKETTWWTSAEVGQEPRGPLWNRTRRAAGARDTGATPIDGNLGLTDTAAATIPNSNMYVFNVVKGAGVWYRGRAAAGTRAESATQIDTNKEIFATYTAGLNNGTRQVGAVIDVT